MFAMRISCLSLVIMMVCAGWSRGDAAPAADAPVVVDLSTVWGGEPVVPLSDHRGQVVLNGRWKFMPALGPAADQPAAQGWGAIWVPGAWTTEGVWWARVPGIAAEGNGPMWSKPLNEVDRAWYQRPVEIPAGWTGRAILLDLQRVSTDASVYIDGKKVGAVSSPGGVVDITDAVTPGEQHTLALEVLASIDREQVMVFMETATAQVSTQQAKLDSRGVTGDVVLVSRPKGGHVSDVFVQPSVRQKKLTVDVELTGVDKAQRVLVTARALDEQGQVEKTFEQAADVAAGQAQTVQLSFPWENPRLWDLRQPNLYTLQVSVKGESIEDSYRQTFGFREFWIDGRDFYLNGSRIHLRPNNAGGKVGMALLEDALIDGLLAAGFNFAELWPNDDGVRGAINWRKEFLDRADRKGLLVSGNVGYMNDHITSVTGYIWDKPQGKPLSSSNWRGRCDHCAITPRSSCGARAAISSAMSGTRTRASWAAAPGFQRPMRSGIAMRPRDARVST